MTLEELQRAYEALRVRVARLEQRLGDLEPETMPGIAAGHSSVPSESPMLDALADALEAFGNSGRG